MRSFFLYLLSLCCFAPQATAQTTDTGHHTARDSAGNFHRYSYTRTTNISILAGGNYFLHSFGEVGVAYNSYGIAGYHSYGSAVYLSNEIRIDNRLLMGPKIGGWISGGVGGMCMGASLIYYTDFSAASLRIRLEAGLGMDIWKLTYGYNFALTNKSFPGINTHVLSATVLINVKRIKETKIEADNNLLSTEKKKRLPIGKDTFVTKTGLLLLGGAGGWRNGLGELGIAYYSDDQERYEENGMVYLTAEVLRGAKPVYGFKVGNFSYGYKPFGICGSMPIIYYTDFKSNSWSLRPECGLHYKKLMLLYGYNIFLATYKYPGISHHQVSLLIGIRLKRNKDEVAVVDKYE